MMKRRLPVLMAMMVLCILSIGAWLGQRVRLPGDYVSVAGAPRIEPDYTGSTIPYNIAPLNFNIRNKAEAYVVSIYPSDNSGSAINLASKSGSIVIDPGKWHRMLEASKGKELVFSIYTRDAEGQWTRHGDIANHVSKHPIPGYLSYRHLKPTYNWWLDIDILQQSLENSKVSTIFDNAASDHTCVNCHIVAAGNPQTMAMGFRSSENGVGTLIYSDGELKRISAKWGYTSWHPSGRLAAYSINKVRQFFHRTGLEIRDVVDLDSAIAYYSLEKGRAIKIDALTEKDYLETYPHFSPDGKYLYFCRAPILWEDRNTVPPKRFKEVRYSIMRISYDVDTDTWGELEMVLSAEDTGKSLLIPRVSPDGRHMIFCMCNYGCFPIYQPSSDLYTMDLQTRQVRPLEILNSPYSESWHNYSNSGRWLVFSSKRQGGLFTRPHFSFIDDEGNAHKPFVLPQKDPEHYYKTLQTYSVPEFMVAPAAVSPRALSRIVQRKDRMIEVNQPISGATKTYGAKTELEANDRE